MSKKSLSNSQFGPGQQNRMQGASGCTASQKYAKGGAVKLTGGSAKNSTSHGKAQAFSGNLMKKSGVQKMGAKMGAKKAPKGF